MIVVSDASALVEYLLRTDLSAALRGVIEDKETDLHIPALCDVEITSALRRAIASRLIGESRAGEALETYLDLPLSRHGHQTLLARVLSLRQNFSAYDATYVALAERLGAELLTADQHLARSVAKHTTVALFSRRT